MVGPQISKVATHPVPMMQVALLVLIWAPRPQNDLLKEIEPWVLRSHGLLVWPDQRCP